MKEVPLRRGTSSDTAKPLGPTKPQIVRRVIRAGQWIRALLRKPCVVCGTRHPGFLERDGQETPYCPRVPGNTQSRYREIRREVGARGVATGNLNDVCIDDLLLRYQSQRVVIEMLVADPRPPEVAAIVGPRFTTKTMERI